MMMFLQHLYVDADNVVMVPTLCADNVDVVEFTTLCVDDDDIVSTFLC